LGLTKHRATDGQALHAVRADRLAPRRTTGTPNACRCETWRVDSSCGAPNLAKSRHHPLWHLVCTRAKLRTRPSSCSYLVGDSSSQILKCYKTVPMSCSPEPIPK
jgi:hypothetical protein